MTMSLSDGINSKALHPRHICVGVKIVLPGSFAVQTNGQKVALELLHHRLEVVIVEAVLVAEPGGLEHTVNQLPDLLVTQTPVIGQ